MFGSDLQTQSCYILPRLDGNVFDTVSDTLCMYVVEASQTRIDFNRLR